MNTKSTVEILQNLIKTTEIQKGQLSTVSGATFAEGMIAAYRLSILLIKANGV